MCVGASRCAESRAESVDSRMEGPLQGKSRKATKHPIDGFIYPLSSQTAAASGSEGHSDDAAAASEQQSQQSGGARATHGGGGSRVAEACC